MEQLFFAFSALLSVGWVKVSGNGSKNSQEKRQKDALKALSNIQAKFRGDRARAVHVKRAREGKSMVCPFVASTPRVVDDILALVGPISNKDIVYDLGSGDGPILIGIAAATGARCKGIEIDALLCTTARRHAVEACVGHLVSIECGDVAEAKFDDGTVIVIFLVPSCLDVLAPMLRKQCPPGTRVVAYKFPLPEDEDHGGWLPEATAATEDVVKKGADTKLYFYRT